MLNPRTGSDYYRGDVQKLQDKLCCSFERRFDSELGWVLKRPVAVWADGFSGRHHKPAVGACGGLGIAQWRAAGNTTAFSQWVGCAAEFTRHTLKSFRQGM
jgi:hypothetical protein